MAQQIHSDHNGVLVVAHEGALNADNPIDVKAHYYTTFHGSSTTNLKFQLGPVKDNKPNGFTNEALLAILIHRTEILDSYYPSEENKIAIQHMKDAFASFEARTAKRIARGVEGQNKV